MSWESTDVVRFDLEPCCQGRMRIAKLESAYNSSIMSLGCETNQKQIMGRESSDVVRFDFGPLL